MFKLAVVFLAVLSCAAAKPGLIGAPLAYTAPASIVAAPAPVVTATSSQYIARNHNGIATAPVVAPLATPVAAYTSHIAAPFTYSAPLTFNAVPTNVLL